MSYTYGNVITQSVTLRKAGVVEVDGAVLQGFPNGVGYWTCRLSIDGVVVWQPGGTNFEVTVQIGGLRYCDAGERVVTLDWAADTNVRLEQAFIKIKGFNNTTS